MELTHLRLSIVRGDFLPALLWQLFYVTCWRSTDAFHRPYVLWLDYSDQLLHSDPRFNTKWSEVLWTTGSDICHAHGRYPGNVPANICSTHLHVALQEFCAKYLFPWTWRKFREMLQYTAVRCMFHTMNMCPVRWVCFEKLFKFRVFLLRICAWWPIIMTGCHDYRFPCCPKKYEETVGR
jgi:hypothetical protein